MSRGAGIELTQSSVRIAVFEGTPKKHALIDYQEEVLDATDPEERVEQVRAIISEILSNKENRGLDVVTSIDSRRATLREISVPFTKNEQIAKTIRFEAETALHTHSIDDVVVEFLKCEEHEDSSRLLVCAVTKERIQEHLDELKAIEIDPIHVELDATALATAFSVTPLHDPERTALLVHVGDTSTRLVYIEKGHIARIRSFWSRKYSNATNGVEAQSAGATTSTSSDDASGTAPDADRSNGHTAATASPTDAPEFGTADSGKAESGNSEAVGDPASTGNASTGNPAATGTAGPLFESSNLQDEIARRFDEIEKSLEVHDEGLSEEEDLPFVILSDEELQSLGDEEYEVLDPLDASDLYMLDDSASPSSDVEEPVSPNEAFSRSDAESTSVAVATATAPRTSSVSAPAALGTSIDRLVVEIERTFAAQLLTESIDLIVVSGDVDSTTTTELAERLETDAVRFDFGDSFPIEADVELAELATHGVAAVGLGLRAMGLGMTDFDLRKEGFRFERRFAKLMPSLTVAAALLCATSLYWCLSGVFALKHHSRETMALVQNQRAATEEFFGEPVSKSKNANFAAASRKKIEAFKNPAGGKTKTRIKEYVRPTDVFSEFLTAIAGIKPDVYPAYERFDFSLYKNRSQKSRVVLHVKDRDESNLVREALERSLRMFDVQVSTDTEDDGVKLTVNLSFKNSMLSN